MAAMVIPKHFTLVNQTWQVVYDETLDSGIMGECRQEKLEIAIRPGLSPQIEEHTFLHELCHAICLALGWQKLNKDEGKIDALSGVLHQFLQTRTGNVSRNVN